MEIPNFPYNVRVRGMPLTAAHPGNVYFVNNSTVLADGGVGGSDGNDGSYSRPFSTLDYAIGQCKASRGDIIMIMPGHIEAVTVGSIAIDVAGVAIVGLGEGDLRPKFNFGVTTSNIIMSGANCSLCNVILKSTVDSVVAGLTITGAGCTVDIETADTSAAVEFISPIVTQATADNLHIDWRHRGFAAGDACTRGIDLVGCRDAVINVDFFGIASVAVVNMRTTACDNVKIFGEFYNDSAALTKNVVNSTTSTWSVVGNDNKGGYRFYGSDDQAVVASGVVSTTSALGTDGTTITDSATTVLGAVGANNADNAFSSSSVVANADGSVLEREEYIQSDMLSLPRCFESSVSALTSGNNSLFTVSGGPIKILEIIGIVTTSVQAQATSCKLTMTTTAPAATVDISASAIDLTGIAAGTSIRHINTTAILTPVTAGYVMEGNAFATNDTQFLIPIGIIKLNNASATNTGVIKWYIRYVPLSQNSRVA